MGDAHYSRQDIVNALRAIGLRAGDVVFSHSNIGFLGFPTGGHSVRNAFETILSGFMDVLGRRGTLVVPTFTYSFPKNEPFDPANSPSTCGVFTEMLRRYPDVKRSHDPCVSVAAIGARADELTRDAPVSSYGNNSFFDRFYEARGVICNINFDAGSTFVHYVERKLGVPYRFDKTFSGILFHQGREETRESTILVRYTSSDDTVTKFEAFDQLARDEGVFRTARLGRGSVGLIAAEDTFELIAKSLAARPWLLTAADRTGVDPILEPEDNQQ